MIKTLGVENLVLQPFFPDPLLLFNFKEAFFQGYKRLYCISKYVLDYEKVYNIRQLHTIRDVRRLGLFLYVFSLWEQMLFLYAALRKNI
jgi:hypothetical protein